MAIVAVVTVIACCLGIFGLHAGVSFGYVSPLITEQAIAIANASSTSECCVQESVLLEDALLCLVNGSCVSFTQTFGNISAASLAVSLTANVSTCSVPLDPFTCVPSAISIVNLEANVTGLGGMLTSCASPMPQSCFNLSGQTCPGGAVQHSCIPQNLTLNYVFADMVILQNYSFSDAVNATDFLTLQPASLTSNTTTLPANVTCPSGPVVNQECYTLGGGGGASTVCSSSIPAACYPSMLNFFTVTIQDTMTIAPGANVTCAGGPISIGCMPSSALARDGSGDVVVTGTLTATGGITGTATGFFGTLAGDVTGTQGATNVVGIQGVPVHFGTKRSDAGTGTKSSDAGPVSSDAKGSRGTVPPVVTKFLFLVGGVWTAEAPTTANLTLGGDASGLAATSIVTELQGQPIASDGTQVPALNQVLRYTSGAWRASTFVPILSVNMYYMRARLTAPYTTVGTSSPWTALEGSGYLNASAYYVAPVAGLYHVRASGTVGLFSDAWTDAPGPAFFVNDVFVEYIHNFGQILNPGTPQNFEGAMFAQLNAGDTTSIGNTVNSGMTSTSWSAWEVYRRSN
jgi:hypothetical protein